MTPPISHIFDKSSCLGSRQLKAYIAGTMSHEERHAAEHHINSCQLCGEAIEGLQAGKGTEALNMVSMMGDGFLRSYIKTARPHDQAPPPEILKPVKRKIRTSYVGNTAGTFAPLISAVLILCVYLALQKPDLTQAKTVAAKVHRQPAAEAVVIPVAHRVEQKAAEEEQQLLAAVETEERPVEQPINNIPKVRPVSLRAAGVLNTDVVATLAAKTQDKEAEAAIPPKPKAEPEKPKIVSEPVVAKAEPAKANDDNGEKGMELFESENWAGALNSFKKEMVRGDTEHRQEATLMAAKSLQKLGKTQEAKQLLGAVADSDGPKHRAAKRMLRRMNIDNE